MHIFTSKAARAILSRNNLVSRRSSIKSARPADIVKARRQNDRLTVSSSKTTLDSFKKLTPAELKKVQELKKTDAEVRAHESAHLAAAGPYASQANFQYQIGPDGRRYAVSGDVKIDTSEISGNPEATLKKAEIVKKAANAPKDPSPQDKKVAAEAQEMATQALRDIAAENVEAEKERIEEDKEASTSAKSETSATTVTITPVESSEAATSAESDASSKSEASRTSTSSTPPPPQQQPTPAASPQKHEVASILDLIF